MSILVADWNCLDDALTLAEEYVVGVEVQEFCNPDMIDNHSDAAKAIAARLEGIPLRGFHGPFNELIPASRDRLIREATRTRLLSADQLATTVGAQHLVFHTGYIPKTYPRDAWLASSTHFWVGLLAELSGGVAVHLENVFEDDHTAMVELLDGVNEALQREALTACLDIGHVNANSSRPLREWIAGLGPRIRYVHLHNNWGVLDDHLGFARGQIDVDACLEGLLRYAPGADWTVEMPADEAEDSLEWLRERGFYQG